MKSDVRSVIGMEDSVEQDFSCPKWTKFFAAVGIVATVVLILLVLGAVIWANHFIDANLYVA